MGFIADIFSGDKGAGFEAKDTPLQKPTTDKQAQEAYQNAQGAYSQSQAALQKQQDFLNAISAVGGIQNQQNVYNQLQNIAAGEGPNPAQAMLNNATGQNVANQAALMASQRGSAVNPALIARLAAQQGAANQQNAAGQAAALQAQQGLNAINQMGNISGQQVAQQAAATQGVSQGAQALNNAAQGLQSNVLNAIQGQNQAQVGAVGSQNSANAGVQSQVAGAQGEILKQASGGAAQMFLADGGEIHKGPSSKVGQHLNKGGNAKKVDVMLSPGEKTLSKQEAKEVASGKKEIGSVGKKVPGKAEVKGDSLKNDKVPKKMKEGDFVIPRSIMNSDDAAKKAAAFVREHMSRKEALSKK